MAVAHELIETEIIETETLPELARDLGATSVPRVLIERGGCEPLLLLGSQTEESFLEAIGL